MSKQPDPADVPVESEDIRSFTERLADWSESLSPAHQAIAHIMLQYSRDLQPEDVRRKQLITNLDQATVSAVEAVREQWKVNAPTAWVQTGPVWEKANPRVLGGPVEQYEIVQWTYVNPENRTPPYA
ncbi:hypothetical protein [Mycolicibacterium fluoranthenivorans]|jgi:hypothetical protein|uniref:Uncharacterized protein n=1 Tax=Mycolicibacterium fluoranthenivorans TaxID=258505 RepID=A0A1G4WRJ7_9MYCO|nr:hypothetical protein [Mycolicibacterium fluoranthenivorans]SCX28041.1 hypothetical protein SAMN02799620_04504 [Mycolicibacterium fluoranthenivorans]